MMKGQGRGEEDIFRVDPEAAERAGGVGVEPGVDALDVEGVAAFGEEAEDLGVVEAAEADGAVEVVVMAVAAAEEEGAEAEDGEGFHDGAVDAGVLSGGDGGGGEGKGRRSCCVEVVVVIVITVVVDTVFGVEEKEEDNGKDGGEDADDDSNAGSEGREAGWGGR